MRRTIQRSVAVAGLPKTVAIRLGLADNQLALLKAAGAGAPAGLGRARTGEIRSVREKGYAISDEELEVGLRSLAVPVARSTGEIIAAVSVSAFSARVRATSSVA